MCSKRKSKTKTTVKDLNDTDISNPSDKEFKVIVIKMLTEIWRMDEHSENFNYERKKESTKQKSEKKNAELK